MLEVSHRGFGAFSDHHGPAVSIVLQYKKIEKERRARIKSTLFPFGFCTGYLYYIYKYYIFSSKRAFYSKLLVLPRTTNPNVHMHKQTDGSLNLGGQPLADLRNIGKLCSLSVRCKIDAANPMQQQPPSSSALDLVEQNPFATWLLALSELDASSAACRLMVLCI